MDDLKKRIVRPHEEIGRELEAFHDLPGCKREPEQSEGSLEMELADAKLEIKRLSDRNWFQQRYIERLSNALENSHTVIVGKSERVEKAEHELREAILDHNQRVKTEQIESPIRTIIPF